MAGSLDGRTVLLVEDDADVRELLEVTLSHHGARVCLAKNAEDALVALQGVQADVLVSDIGLPGCDGLELIRSVRAGDLERGAAIPAVALTGFSREKDKHEILEAGYQAHLSKPLDLTLLVETLVRLTATR